MDVPLTQLADAARAWDEQHLDVAAAARQIGDAPTDGFTSPVMGAADRFAAAWRRHASDLAGAAEGRADGLRATAADLVETDGLVAEGHLAAADRLREVR